MVPYCFLFLLSVFILFGKELFIRFTASAFRKLPSIYIFSYFPFGFESRMWDLIVSVPDHCLSFYFGDSLRTAEDRGGWKGIVATSSVVPRRPPGLRD